MRCTDLILSQITSILGFLARNTPLASALQLFDWQIEACLYPRMRQGRLLVPYGWDRMTTNAILGMGLEQGRGFVSGMSPAMRTLESVIIEIASTNIPVLLIGESGTGKEMFAQRVH